MLCKYKLFNLFLNINLTQTPLGTICLCVFCKAKDRVLMNLKQKNKTLSNHQICLFADTLFCLSHTLPVPFAFALLIGFICCIDCSIKRDLGYLLNLQCSRKKLWAFCAPTHLQILSILICNCSIMWYLDLILAINSHSWLYAIYFRRLQFIISFIFFFNDLIFHNNENSIHFTIAFFSPQVITTRNDYL